MADRGGSFLAAAFRGWLLVVLFSVSQIGFTQDKSGVSETVTITQRYDLQRTLNGKLSLIHI